MGEKKACPNPRVAKWLVNWAASVPDEFWPHKVRRVVRACPSVARAIEERRGEVPSEEGKT